MRAALVPTEVSESWSSWLFYSRESVAESTLQGFAAGHGRSCAVSESRTRRPCELRTFHQTLNLQLNLLREESPRDRCSPPAAQTELFVSETSLDSCPAPCRLHLTSTPPVTAKPPQMSRFAALGAGGAASESMPVEEVDADEKDFETFQLKPLQVETKLKVSGPLKDAPSYASLLAVSQKYGYAVYATTKGFAFAYTKDIRDVIRKADPRAIVPFSKQVDVAVSDGAVHHVKLSADELTVIVGVKGAVLLFDVKHLAAGTAVDPFSRINMNASVVDIRPNPETFPDRCAVLDDSGNLTIVPFGGEVVAVPIPGLTSMCWSKKGKQLAVGDRNGTIFQVTPAGQVKNKIPRPGSVSDGMIVRHILWLEKPFVIIYEDPASEERKVAVVLQEGTQTDSYPALKKKTIVHGLIDPIFLSPGRGPGAYTECIRGWWDDRAMEGDEAKYAIIFADQRSVDLGFAGCDSQGTWANWNLSDSVTMPLDPNEVDTWAVGLAIDSTSTDTLPGMTPDEPAIPPVPVVLILASEGWLLAYDCVNYAAARRNQRCEMVVVAESVPPPTGPGKPQTPAAPAAVSQPASAAASSSPAVSAPASSEPWTAFAHSSNLTPFSGSSQSSSSIFGSASTTQPTGSLLNSAPPQSATSIFGSPLATQPNGSLFNSTTTLPTGGIVGSMPGNILGSAGAPKLSTGIFDKPVTAPVAKPGVFATAPKPTGGLFAPKADAPARNVFGASATSTPPSSSSTSTASAQPVFGTPTTYGAAQPSSIAFGTKDTGAKAPAVPGFARKKSDPAPVPFAKPAAAVPKQIPQAPKIAEAPKPSQQDTQKVLEQKFDDLYINAEKNMQLLFSHTRSIHLPGSEAQIALTVELEEKMKALDLAGSDIIAQLKAVGEKRDTLKARMLAAELKAQESEARLTALADPQKEIPHHELGPEMQEMREGLAARRKVSSRSEGKGCLTVYDFAAMLVALDAVTKAFEEARIDPQGKRKPTRSEFLGFSSASSVAPNYDAMCRSTLQITQTILATGNVLGKLEKQLGALIPADEKGPKPTVTRSAYGIFGDDEWAEEALGRPTGNPDQVVEAQLELRSKVKTALGSPSRAVPVNRSMRTPTVPAALLRRTPLAKKGAASAIPVTPKSVLSDITPPASAPVDAPLPVKKKPVIAPSSPTVPAPAPPSFTTFFNKPSGIPSAVDTAAGFSLPSKPLFTSAFGSPAFGSSPAPTPPGGSLFKGFSSSTAPSPVPAFASPATSRASTPGFGESGADKEKGGSSAVPAPKWTCDTCMVPNVAAAGKCVACESPRPGAVPATKWTCAICMVPNLAAAGKCVACESPRSGAVGAAVTKPAAVGGFGPGGGFSFGAQPKEDGTKPAAVGGFGAGGGFSFSGTPKEDGKKPAAVGGFALGAKLGAPKEDEKKPTPVVGFGTGGGFKFGGTLAPKPAATGSGGGIAFGEPAKKDASEDELEESDEGSFGEVDSGHELDSGSGGEEDDEDEDADEGTSSIAARPESPELPVQSKRLKPFGGSGGGSPSSPIPPTASPGFGSGGGFSLGGGAAKPAPVFGAAGGFSFAGNTAKVEERAGSPTPAAPSKVSFGGPSTVSFGGFSPAAQSASAGSVKSDCSPNPAATGFSFGSASSPLPDAEAERESAPGSPTKSEDSPESPVRKKAASAEPEPAPSPPRTAFGFGSGLKTPPVAKSPLPSKLPQPSASRTSTPSPTKSASGRAPSRSPSPAKGVSERAPSPASSPRGQAVSERAPSPAPSPKGKATAVEEPEDGDDAEDEERPAEGASDTCPRMPETPPADVPSPTPPPRQKTPEPPAPGPSNPAPQPPAAAAQPSAQPASSGADSDDDMGMGGGGGEKSVFGLGRKATPGAVNPMFGGFASTPAASCKFGCSIFRRPASSGSAFGTSSAGSSSPFGGATAKAASPFGGTTASPFGGPTANTRSPFGGLSTPVTSSSPFASAVAPPQPAFGAPGAFGGGSAFGQTSAAPAFGQTSAPSAFGQPASGSAFGQPASGSAFGQVASAPAAGSVFGQGASAPASVSAFGQGASAPASVSAFGQGASAPAFGQQASTSMFGQAAPAPAYGQTSSAPAFGQTAAPSAFNQPTTAFGQTGFGGGGFGAPAASAAPAFGQPSSLGGAFGTAAPTFGSTSFGSGAFGSVAPTFGQSVFGASSLGAIAPVAASIASVNSGGFASFSGQQSGFASLSANQPSIFDQSPNTFGAQQQQPGGFGAFGQQQQQQQQQQSPFGQFANANSGGSVFGGNSGGSLFGGGGGGGSPFGGGGSSSSSSSSFKPSGASFTAHRGPELRVSDAGRCIGRASKQRSKSSTDGVPFPCSQIVPIPLPVKSAE
ncbi:hypothetical protein BDK51DRAFT_40517 [Blyttiomyces helicus]|uniref:Nuclear pore complex protein Nup153 n=1 Tax=Blyttiomyces helicus TaxID=388810 RepID=A0A4P9WJ62_9FUNG|nr:hypothetical protein BDK51DRAFT_40517 [Blyttiomyces helicus]|eukprot:RKO92951.1 hypothetical protein BDK51DRAFT_40517 [Blyttiomyces helicus]